MADGCIGVKSRRQTGMFPGPSVSQLPVFLRVDDKMEAASQLESWRMTFSGVPLLMAGAFGLSVQGGKSNNNNNTERKKQHPAFYLTVIYPRSPFSFYVQVWPMFTVCLIPTSTRTVRDRTVENKHSASQPQMLKIDSKQHLNHQKRSTFCSRVFKSFITAIKQTVQKTTHCKIILLFINSHTETNYSGQPLCSDVLQRSNIF